VPFFKITFLFNQRRHGWSETWYRESSTLKDNRIPASQLAAARSNLLGLGSILEAIRMTSLDKPYKHILQPFKAAPSSWGNNSDQAPAAILARLHDSELVYDRLITLRGCPDEEISYDDAGNPLPVSNPFDSAFQFFVTQLKTLGFRWKARDKTGVGGTIWNVAGLSLDVDRRLIFNIPAFAPAANSLFTVSDFIGAQATTPNGKHQVKSAVGGSIVTNTIMPVGWDPVNWTMGTARAIAVNNPVPDTGVILRPGKRDTGRAFFVSRGRRKASKKLQFTPAE